MEVNLGQWVHSIAIKPSEILDMLKQQKILPCDMEYFCSLLHLFVVSKERDLGIGITRRYLQIHTSLNKANRATSANMCLSLLEAAGTSKKEQARFRNNLRKDCRAVIWNGEVITCAFSPCLDFLLHGSMNAILHRALIAGEKFIETHLQPLAQFDNLGYRLDDCQKVILNDQVFQSEKLRIGLLVLADKNHPEFEMYNEYGV